MRETALTEGIYDHINRFIKNPRNIIDEYLKENTDKKEEKKYKKEIDENNIKIQELYKVVEELFDNLTSERNTSFKTIIQNKIDTNREKIENLEARNKELSELIRSQNDIIESSKEILSFSEKMKGKDVNTFSRTDQIKLIHLMVKKIVINTDEIDVFYTFGNDDEDEDGGDGGSDDDSPLLD